MNTSHEATAFSIEIGVYFLLKCCLVQVSASDPNAHCDSLLEGFAGNVLVHSDGRIDSATFAEKRSDRATGSLWCDKDDIYVLGDVNFSEILEDR